MTFRKITEEDSLYDGLENYSVADLVHSINAEDQKVALAVAKVLPQITALIEKVEVQLGAGGRLFYMGAGTSGRLGILDASECPPTFGVDNNLVIGVIAGGDKAIRNSQEFAEDSTNQGWLDLKEKKINQVYEHSGHKWYFEQENVHRRFFHSCQSPQSFLVLLLKFIGVNASKLWLTMKNQQRTNEPNAPYARNGTMTLDNPWMYAGTPRSKPKCRTLPSRYSAISFFIKPLYSTPGDARSIRMFCASPTCAASHKNGHMSGA